MSFAYQGKCVKVERIQREVLGVQRRVLGEEHPDTLTSAGNLAMSFAYQGKYAEAEEMLQAALAAQQRVLGSAHPDTLSIAKSLEVVRSEMRAKQPTKKGVKAAACRSSRPAEAPLSPTALAEAEARAGEAEAELLAMLELEEAGIDRASSSGKGKAKGKAKGNLPGQGEQALIACGDQCAPAQVLWSLPLSSGPCP
jgi:hypothetical protein